MATTEPSLISFHEDRIQTLEQNVNEANTQLGQHGVKLENIKAQVEDVKVGIERKIDEGFDTLHKELHKTNTTLTAVAATVQGHTDNLGKLNEADQKRKNRVDAIKKAAGAVLLLILGAFAKEGAVLVFGWFGH